jgi:hypothetical protein
MERLDPHADQLELPLADSRLGGHHPSCAAAQVVAAACNSWPTFCGLAEIPRCPNSADSLRVLSTVQRSADPDRLAPWAR